MNFEPFQICNQATHQQVNESESETTGKSVENPDDFTIDTAASGFLKHMISAPSWVICIYASIVVSVQSLLQIVITGILIRQYYH